MKIFGPSGGSQHDVVVEVDETFGQTRNTMQIAFDGWTAKGGEIIGVGKNFIVVDHVKPWVVHVDPRRDLVGRHDVDASYPRCKTKDGTQRIAQFLVVAVTVV